MKGPKSLATGKIPAVVWPALAVALAWLVLIRQVQHHWGGESYYNFGWFVPFLAIWLLLKNLGRIELRPGGPAWLVLLAAAGSVALVLPFHALSEVNPFWRLPLWIQAAGLCGFSLSILYGVCGKAGVRAGLFPLFFLCTMIPWPYRIEVMVVQALTGVVSEIALAGIHLLGFPVQLAGNSFVLGDLQIGVNEACSGIRSLQALFMVTLFLGSLFGQGHLRRLLAVAVLPLIVIAVNSVRAVFLALQVIVHGDAAYDAWHDPAGYIAFAVSMVLIYACIELLNIGSKQREPMSGPVLQKLAASFSRLSLPRAMAALPVLPLLLFALVEGWFQYHESKPGTGMDWRLALPSADDPAVRFELIHKAVAGLLGFSYGHRFFYQPDPTTVLEFYYYGYELENRLASVSAYGHSPAICMESVGADMVRQFANLPVTVDGVTLHLQHYLFRLPRTGRLLHVFWVVWERRNMDIDPDDLAALDYRMQWVQLVKGRRDFTRKVLLVSLAGVEEESRARETVRRILTPWIETQPGL